MSSNYVDSTGLVLQTLADIVTELETGFKNIYGVDINIDANSPDGQMINLFAQAKIDLLDCIASVYNSFSPTNCSGVVLDQRCALNGLYRNAGIKTTLYMTVVTNRIVNLVGVSAGAGTTPFTVSDPAGNLFYLKTSTTTINGTNTGLEFEASVMGTIEVSPGTIVSISTPTLGVLTVTNPGGALIAGKDEESDASFRYRRDASVANPSTGYLEGLQGSILALDNVDHAKVYENNTSITDIYSIPAHSIYPVVDGGDETEIAELIYLKRNAGCGMWGGTGSTGPTGTQHVVGVTQVNGLIFNVKFAEPTYANLYIALTLTKYDSNHYIDQTFIKDTIYEQITYDINQVADFSAITSVIKAADPYVVIAAGGVGSAGGTGASHPYLATAAINNRWIISTTNISITEA
jgi:uncharacterized phage protein gp47/JayE